MTFDHHFVFAVLSMLIAFSTMTYSSWQIYRRIIQPHAFTVLVWSVVTSIVFFSMLAEGAGAAAWRTALIAVMTFLNFVLSLRNGFGYINKFDVAMLVAALSGIPLWIVMDDPEISLFWLTAVGFCGTVPTIRKAWNFPHHFSAWVYFFTCVAIFMQMASLTVMTPGIVTYLSVTGATFLLISALLVYRRSNAA